MLLHAANHAVHALTSVSVLLGCPVTASIPGHCSRERTRPGLFPKVRIDESIMLRRGKESLATWMQASPFALVHPACAMRWMFLISMRNVHRYNSLDAVR